MAFDISSQAAELKSQGAIEAAQDPNSQVTAGDARQTLMDESKRAGGAAYEFNPNASPEEKAAAARAVGLPTCALPFDILLNPFL